MHLLLLSLLLGGEPPARFEADGLRLGAALVADPTLSMTPDGRLLASRTQLESLGAPVPVDLGRGKTLVVHPGLRVERAAAGVVLRARLGRRIALTIGGERTVLASPATLDGRDWAVAQADAAPAQDDVDANLKKMQDAAKKAQETPPPPPATTPPPVPTSKAGLFDWSRTFNPYVISQPVSPVAVTSLRPLSDIGFRVP